MRRPVRHQQRPGSIFLIRGAGRQAAADFDGRRRERLLEQASGGGPVQDDPPDRGPLRQKSRNVIVDRIFDLVVGRADDFAGRHHIPQREALPFQEFDLIDIRAAGQVGHAEHRRQKPPEPVCRIAVILLALAGHGAGKRAENQQARLRRSHRSEAG